jgi:hypothetical protein
MGVYLIGLHLIGAYLTGLHLIGVYLMDESGQRRALARVVRMCHRTISRRRPGLWPWRQVLHLSPLDRVARQQSYGVE